IHAYKDLNLTLGSGIYGSTFFMLTGFHGVHVALGMVMLAVMWFRVLKGHFTKDKHFAFEAAAWYWHFVDVVWLGLFLFVYVLYAAMGARRFALDAKRTSPATRAPHGRPRSFHHHQRIPVWQLSRQPRAAGSRRSRCRARPAGSGRWTGRCGGSAHSRCACFRRGRP